MTAIATATPTSVARQRAGWPTQAGETFLRWTRNTLRQPWGVGASLVQPIVWILLFGEVFSSLGSLPGFPAESYITFLVPGVLMMTVLYSGAWAGTGYIEDMSSGVMNQLLTAPVRRSALVAGQLAQQVLVMGVQSIIVLLIGWAGGARYPGGPVGILLALGAALLLTVIFCSFSTALALITGSQLALIGISQIVVLPATFLSGAMMSSDLMPGWVRHVADYNPVGWAVQIGRDALSGNAAGSTTAWHALLLALLGLLAFLWSVRAFRTYQHSL